MSDPRSLTDAIALIMAEKIPGYEDADVCLEAILQKGLPNYLARISPMGYVGPLAFRGDYIKGLVEVTVDGSVKFNHQIVHEIVRQQKDAIAEYRESTQSVKPARDYGYRLRVSR